MASLIIKQYLSGLVQKWEWYEVQSDAETAWDLIPEELVPPQYASMSHSVTHQVEYP